MIEPEDPTSSGILDSSPINVGALAAELREINRTLKVIAHELRKGRP